MTKQSKKTLKNILCGIVSFLLLGGIIVGSIALAQNVDFRVKTPEEKLEQPEDEANGGGLLAPDEHEANGISIKKLEIPVELYNDYGVSAAAETALQLSVTSSNGGDLSDGNFSIIFDNPSSTWASGKTLSEYVTLSQSDSTHATISCLKAFGEPIKVVYTYTGEDGDGTVKTMTAEYRLDYAKRLISWCLERDDGGYLMSNDTPASAKFTYPQLNKVVYYTLNSAGQGVTYSDYTVDDTFVINSSSSFSLTDSFKSACQTAGITLPGANKTGSVSGDKLNATDGTATILSYYFGDSVWQTEAFRNVLNAQSDTGIFQIDVTLTGTHSEVTATIKIGVVSASLPVAPQGVQIQDQFGGSSYIF